jgi:hypothetical protein
LSGEATGLAANKEDGMPRTRRTAKSGRTAKPKPAPAAPAAEAPPTKPKTERITAFNSHGARFYRMTLPRDWAARYESAANRWECEIADDGTVTFKPVGRLVKAS